MSHFSKIVDEHKRKLAQLEKVIEQKKEEESEQSKSYVGGPSSISMIGIA